DKHGEWTRQYMRSRRGAYMARAYAEVQERGPLAAADLSNPGKRSGNWWGWSSGKAALEHLYDAGLLAIAGRRGFERLYDRAEGWKAPAYLHRQARVPKSVAARAFITPFDSLVWHRPRLARLYGMTYSIEIYTPVAKRVYGYYVCPFLLGDMIVARADLKADRSRGVLVVHSVHLEPGHEARRVLPELAMELRELRSWLGLERIEVARPAELRRL